VLENSSILITGGTGSFGKTFIPMTLKKYNPKRIVVFSRDEMKQWEMAKKYTNDKRIRFFIGDVRDKDRLWRALKDIDYVVHAAALKIVPKAEYDPFECIRTNVNGAMNLIDVAIDRGVKRVVALSTDKACSPSNLYGATKLISDKVFISSNSYSPTTSDTSFSIVRYGNVMGSRGSVIPLFLDKASENVFPITDERMTRFMISLDEAVKLVWHAFVDMYGGEIYIKKIKSMKVIDIAKAINHSAKFNLIGIRPGEKLHEHMIGAEDSPHTYEYETYYKILPAINNWSSDQKRINKGKLVSSDFTYSSNLNKDWMEIKELQNWIQNNMNSINTF
tara:strand:+ start:46 stop:1047 length:1002 start_codon:yes stop_codon:yes gene_type:complete